MTSHTIFEVCELPLGYFSPKSFDTEEEAKGYIRDQYKKAAQRPIDNEYYQHHLDRKYIVRKKEVAIEVISKEYHRHDWVTEEEVIDEMTITPRHESLKGITHYKVIDSLGNDTNTYFFPISRCQKPETAISRAIKTKEEFNPEVNAMYQVTGVVFTRKPNEKIHRETLPINLDPRYS